MQVAHKLSNPSLDMGALLELLPTPVLAMGSDTLVFANAAAEDFLGISATRLKQRPPKNSLPSPVLEILGDVLQKGSSMSRYGVFFAPHKKADVWASRIKDGEGHLCLMTLHPSSLAQQLTPPPQGGERGPFGNGGGACP